MVDKALHYADYREIDIPTAVEAMEKHGAQPPSFSTVVNFLKDAPRPIIMADNTSSQGLADMYPEFLRNGISIVTPNKKAFSASYKLWKNIMEAAEAHESFIYHESSVGAGMPIISTLKDMVETGDQITRIEGVFSGTLSFLFNQYSSIDGSQGGEWSETVRLAKELGYTEPDPRDDLNGLDVARKVTILSRVAGCPIESPKSFPVESLIPKELESMMSADEFLDKLADFDHHMKGRRHAAHSVGKVLRYIGSVDIATGKAEVGVQIVDKSHPAANLKGSDNIISIYTKRYGALPLTIRGAGAGGDVTAMGVTGDLLKIVKQSK